MRHLGGPASALRGPSAATPTRGDAGDGRGERPRRPPGADLAGAPHSSRRRPPGGHLASCRSGALPSPRGGAGTSRGIGGARPPRPLTRPRAARARSLCPAQPMGRRGTAAPPCGLPRARAGPVRTKGLLYGRPPARRGADTEPAPPPRAPASARARRVARARARPPRGLRHAGSGEDTAPARRVHAADREGGAGRGSPCRAAEGL